MAFTEAHTVVRQEVEDEILIKLNQPTSALQLQTDFNHTGKFIHIREKNDRREWMPVAGGTDDFSLIVQHGKITKRHRGTETEIHTDQRIRNVYRSETIRTKEHIDKKGTPVFSVNIAVDENGALYTWGETNNGLLGHVTDQPTDQMSPATIITTVTKPRQITSLRFITSVSLNSNHCIAVDRIGRAYSWGDNSRGQCGHSSDSTSSSIITTPRRITIQQIENDTSVRTASAGAYHSLVVTRDGNIFSFGSNDRGQLGTGNFNPRPDFHSTPIKVDIGKGIHVVAVAAGQAHCIALDKEGQIFSWGSNKHGQIGTTNIKRENIIPKPVHIHAFNERAVHVAAGRHTSFAITHSGDLFTWGEINGGDTELAYETDFPEQVKPLLVHQTHVLVVSVAKTTSQQEIGNILVVDKHGKVYESDRGNVQFTYTTLNKEFHTAKEDDWEYRCVKCERE